MKRYGSSCQDQFLHIAFDGINLLIGAIEKSKNDPEKLQQSLMTIKYEGITGRSGLTKEETG